MKSSNLNSYQKQNIASLINLHSKNHDEPDFDCEFLHTAIQADSESILDPEPDEDLSDDFHDREWDSTIYDPYQESAYF